MWLDTRKWNYVDAMRLSSREFGGSRRGAFIGPAGTSGTLRRSMIDAVIVFEIVTVDIRVNAARVISGPAVDRKLFTATVVLASEMTCMVRER